MRNLIYRTKCILFCLSALAVFSSGCATSNIAKDRVLDDNEGILIARVHTNLSNLTIFIHGRKDILPRARLVGPTEYLSVIPIGAGEASFSGILLGNSEAWFRKVYFNVVPWTVTYVGDVFINVKYSEPSFWSSKTADVQFEVLDKEDESIAIAKKEYPWLFEKYSYRKSLPIFTPKTTEDYNEPPELKELKERLNEEQKKEKNKDGKVGL